MKYANLKKFKFNLFWKCTENKENRNKPGRTKSDLIVPTESIPKTCTP